MSHTNECVVVVTLTPKVGMADSVVTTISRELDEIRGTPGCRQYELYSRVDDAVVLIERWDSRDSWQAHFDTPAISRLKADLTPLLQKPAERWEMVACR